MKKWFLIIGSIILIVLLGSGMITLHGHGQRNYNACVRLGRTDVVNGNYRDALNYFQGARKVSPNNESAKNDLDQVQSYVNGNHYLVRRRLNQSAKSYRRSIKIGSLTALNQRSLCNYKYVNVIRNGSRKFTLLYDQALVLNHRHDFKNSNKHLNRIIDDPHVNLKYFRTFKAKVVKLIKANRHDQRSRQVTPSVNGDRNKSDPFKLKTPKVVADHPSKVTISKARREIKRAGVNENEMGNQDVANLIRQAIKHHSSIYRYAKDNY